MKIGKFSSVLLQLLATVLTLSIAEKSTKVLRAHCIVHDPASIQNVTCWAKPINRTVSLMNMRGNLIRVLNHLHINIQIYKRSDLIFKPYIVNVTEDYCMFFTKNKGSYYLKLLANIYLPYTNMNHTCPYFGYMYVKDLPLDSNKFPALWTPAEYRLDVLLISDGRNIVTVQHFLEIKEQVRHW